MKLVSLVVLLPISFVVSLSAMTVQVEPLLDAPGDNVMFANSSAAYASNGQLLVRSSSPFNLFVLNDDEWVPLIDRYRTDEYNAVPENVLDRGSTTLYDSTVDGEMLYMARRADIPPEHYRVFVNDEGKLEAEWVSEEYYDAHLLRYLSRGWSIEDGLALRYGYRIETPQSTVYTSPSARVPQIVGPDGTVVYNFMEEFPDGFVEWGLSITRNPAGDQVAMVISFVPEEDSPYSR
ncbi:MAG: hypothetical protein ACLFP4_06740 [Spirochaetales bacterium]